MEKNENRGVFGNLMIFYAIKTLKLTKNRRFKGNFVSGQTTFQPHWTRRHALFLKN